ncbi:MAG: XRE family transcriptional regulator, partial [Candidatus Aminicenantes bacterium]
APPPLGQRASNRLPPRWPLRHSCTAKKVGIAQDTLSRILNKRREPSLRLLQIILDALGYKISFQKKQLR